MPDDQTTTGTQAQPGGDQETKQVSTASTDASVTQTEASQTTDKKQTTKTYTEDEVKGLLSRMREETLAEIEKAGAPPDDKTTAAQPPDIDTLLLQRFDSALPQKDVTREDLIKLAREIAKTGAEMGMAFAEKRRTDAEKALQDQDTTERDVLTKTPHLAVFHPYLLHDIRNGQKPDVTIKKYESLLEMAEQMGLNPIDARRRLQAVPNPGPDKRSVPDRFSAWIEPLSSGDEPEKELGKKKSMDLIKTQIANLKPGQSPIGDVDWVKLAAAMKQ